MAIIGYTQDGNLTDPTKPNPQLCCVCVSLRYTFTAQGLNNVTNWAVGGVLT